MGPKPDNLQALFNSDRTVSIFYKVLFSAIFFSTGFSALIFQLIWQRVLTLHAGVDLYSFTTIVTAFMAGLGLGSLFGGYIADRLSIKHCFVSFIISNCVVGFFGFISLWLFYDVYNVLVYYSQNTAISFLFHFALLCIPTTFMGLSLPLLSKALVRTSDEMSSLVGTLYGINTLGAAVGAALGGWFLLGSLGFITSIKIASSINIICGLLVFIILFSLKSDKLSSAEPGSGMMAHSSDMHNSEKEWILIDRPIFWILIYGVTGFAALSLEIIWFRILNVINASSYLFGTFLFIYLCGLGVGCLVSSLIITRIRRPDIIFFWMQFLIGIVSMISVIFLPDVNYIQSVFSINIDGHARTQELVQTFLLLFMPAVFLIGLPTLFMGVSFPLIQRVVARQRMSLGRNLSKLLFSNIMGNILGSFLTGFFLLEYFGTPGTLKLVGGMLLVPGIIAGYYSNNRGLRLFSIALVSLIIGVVIITFPADKDFWTFYQSMKGNDITIAKDFNFIEDRTSFNALAKFSGKEKDYVAVITDGRTPGEIPFGGIHSILGIAPVLYHPDPKTGLVIGFGSGDTLYSMALDKRLQKTTCVELSGGQYELNQKVSMREPLLWQSAKLFDNPRIKLIVADGRKYLLHVREKFDAIEIDAIQHNQAYSGNLYSVEFFEQIRQHLKPGGIFAQWIPTPRSEKSVMKVFPYVIRFKNTFVLASNEPINFSKPELIERINKLDLIEAYGNKEGTSLIKYFTEVDPLVIQHGNTSSFSDKELNYDLLPKDEYFINNDLFTW